MRIAIRMNESDQVATLLSDVEADSHVVVTDKQNNEVMTVFVKNKIPFGNKVAISDLAHGERVMKYGYPIGVTRCPVKSGELIHIHNLKSQKVDIPEITAEEVLKLMGVENKMQWEATDEIQGL